MLIMLRIICMFALTLRVSSLYCYWNTGCQYKLFSSATPYTVVRGDIRDSVWKMPDCESISIWSISRSGKTHPSATTGKQMKDALTLKEHLAMSTNSSLCAQDIENIQRGVVDNEDLTKLTHLSIEGYAEMSGIGRRLRESFPHLLHMLDENNSEILTTNSHWVGDSARAFVYGLTEGNDLVITENNAVTAPYQSCKKYIQEVFSNTKTFDEIAKFIFNSTDYQVVKDRIQRRSGMGYSLSSQDVLNLYDLCRYFWSGINNKQSPWCALFTTDDLKALEYVGDLMTYYRNGYGNPMHQQLVQPSMNGLLTNFQLAKKSSGKKIVAYFTHGTMMDMIYSALGLFKDSKPLSGLNRILARKWRSSYHSNFAANLMAVLYRSDSEFEFSGVPVASAVQKKQPKSATSSKRKASPGSSSEDISRSKKQKTTAVSDIFGILSESEKAAKHTSEVFPVTSSLLTRVSNGHLRRVVPTEGEFYIELKVFKTTDAVSTKADERWKKALVVLKFMTDQDSPRWDSLQKFVKEAYTVFADAEPSFYGDK